MQLYGSYTSPYVRHCRIALLEEGFDCEFITTDQQASAELSPTKRVPFLRDGELLLSDSSSILKYLREKAGKSWLADVCDYDPFCLADTLLDSTTNIFFLEKAGVNPAENSYLQRQQARIDDGLRLLNSRQFSTSNFSDSELRLACYLGWGLFRKRLSLAQLPNLQAFYDNISTYPPFADTAPFE